MLQLPRLASAGLHPLQAKALAAPLPNILKPSSSRLLAVLGTIQTGHIASGLPITKPIKPEPKTTLPPVPMVEKTTLRIVRPWRKLMSYNAQQFYNSGKGKPMKSMASIQALAEAIRLEDPDVIALQEVGDRQLLEEFNRTYLQGNYPNIVTGHVTPDSPMQVAFMSKANMHVVKSRSHWEEISKTAPYGGKRDFLEATFQTDTGYQFTVYNAHCKSMRGSEATTMPVRLQEVTNVAQILRRHFQREPEANVFVAGDFNTLHQSPYGKPVIETLTHIRDDVKEPDLTEVMIKDGKSDPTHSGHGFYPDSKLDYIFVSKPLVKQVRNAYVAGEFNQEPWCKASDHRPYVTVFEESAPVSQARPASTESEERVLQNTLKRKLDRIA